MVYSFPCIISLIKKRVLFIFEEKIKMLKLQVVEILEASQGYNRQVDLACCTLGPK